MSDTEDHEHEFLSQCCGASFASEVPGMCARCHEWTGFECECGKEYVWDYSPNSVLDKDI